MLTISSLIRVVSLVLDMGERGESSCAETVKLILEEHNLFLLLLNDIDHAALVSNGHDLLARIVGRVVTGRRLEIDNLLSLAHFVAQVTSLAFQLVILAFLIFDLLSQLVLLGVESLQAIGRILLKLPNLIVKALLVVLVLLLVLALNDLLGLLGYSVELHI